MIGSGVISSRTNSRYSRNPCAVSATQYCSNTRVCAVGVLEDGVGVGVGVEVRDWLAVGVGVGVGALLQPLKSITRIIVEVPTNVAVVDFLMA